MVYIQSHKEQNWLLPPNIQDMIPEDHVCFLVEGFVEGLDFSTFDRMYEGAGHPAYHPRILLKLLLMGVLDKVRSSRKLARNARENIVYIYLAEKLVPDFRTISDFRKNNPELIKDVFTHTVTLAKQEGLLDLSHLSTDGSKIKASASNKRTLTKGELAFLLQFVEGELEAWAAQDALEEEFFGEVRGSDQLPGNSRKKMQKAVQRYINYYKEKGSLFKEEVRKKLEQARHQVEEHDLKKVSMTDPESRFMRNNKGNIEFSYNAQLTVDKKGFIVANDVCQDRDDHQQLQPQVVQTRENLGTIPKHVAWSFDAGYYSGENLWFLAGEKIDGYLPDQQWAQESKGMTPKLGFQDTLVYDPVHDMFIDPEGRPMLFRYKYVDKTKEGVVRVYALCKNNKVIKITRMNPYFMQRRAMAEKMRSANGREIYKLRSQTVEPVIGDIKENKGFRSFLTRNLERVRTEWNLLCTAVNVRKMWLLMRGRVDAALISLASQS